MGKKMKKIISLLLCSFLTISVLVSCNNEELLNNESTDTGTDTDAETDDGLYHDAVPELDFDGYDFRVLIGTYDRPNQDLFPEEETGDVLNDTIYARNNNIEDRFNIGFTKTEISLFDLLETLRTNVAAGDGAYDYYMQIDRDAFTATSEHLLYPISDLPYVDLTQPYWTQLINQQLTVGNKLYWGVSDEMLSCFEATTLVYFNKKQALDLQLDDFYTLVRDGDWTYDKFFVSAKTAVKDNNGDDKMTVDDNWGILSENDYFYCNMWSGAGILLIEKDSDDIPYFALAENENFTDLVDKYLDTVKGKNNDGTAGVDLNWAKEGSTRINAFKSGSSLFSVGVIQEMSQLRDMPDDFGTLPFPKYSEDQEQYYTMVISAFPFVIPITTQHPEIVGAVMEAMACESRNTVIPAYYESSLKVKYSRDTDTAEMLDLIFNTRWYDLANVIDVYKIRATYTGLFLDGSSNIVSTTAKMQKQFDKQIQKAVEGILDYPEIDTPVE
jgi:hypothetical protein